MKYAKKIVEYYKDSRMPPDIIHAARIGDINEAAAALQEDSNCITKTDFHGMNALQVSLKNFHTDFSLYILAETKISILKKDHLGRDSLDLALIFSNNALGDIIWNKWNQEYQEKFQKEENNVNPFPFPDPD